MTQIYRMYKLQTQKGQVLILSVIILLFLTITIAAFQYYLSVQTKHTVKGVKETSAFNIAQAGLEQAIWKLNSEPRGWERAAGGDIPQGYRGETVYPYRAGGKIEGQYRIRIATSTTRDLTIYSIARDKTGTELAGVKVSYSTTGTEETAIKARGSITLRPVGAGCINVVWAPLEAVNSDIVLSGQAAAVTFPRKFAGRGFVVRHNPDVYPQYPRDPNRAGEWPDAGTYMNYNPPYEKEYWEWHSNYPLEPPSAINMEYYRERARNFIIPTHFRQYISVEGATSPDPNPWDGYFPSGNLKIRGGTHEYPALLYSTTAVFFVENGNIIIEGPQGGGPVDGGEGGGLGGQAGGYLFIGPQDGTIVDNQVAMISARHNIQIQRTVGAHSYYEVSVPENAWKEYQYGDTAAANEYPGDLGYRKSGGTYGISVHAGGILFNGFLYAGDSVSITTEGYYVVLVGAIQANNGNVTVHGNARIYYNQNVGRNVSRYTSSWRKVRGSWAEFNPGCFNNPIWK